MLHNLFGALSASVSTTIDIATKTYDLVAEDIAAIPNSIEKGWNEGLVKLDKEEPDTGDIAEEHH